MTTPVGFAAGQQTAGAEPAASQGAAAQEAVVQHIAATTAGTCCNAAKERATCKVGAKAGYIQAGDPGPGDRPMG